MSDAKAKTARLVAQWPKKCGCGRVYDVPICPEPGAEEWHSLPFHTTTTDEFSTMEWRHCHCGSTLTVHTEIHDLTKE